MYRFVFTIFIALLAFTPVAVFALPTPSAAIQAENQGEIFERAYPPSRPQTQPRPQSPDPHPDNMSHSEYTQGWNIAPPKTSIVDKIKSCFGCGTNPAAYNH